MKFKFLSILALVPTLLFADQISDLDQQIKEFKTARNRAASQAYMAGSQANQFLGQNWVDYQQAVRKQEMYQNQVKLLDERIKELEAEKAALQKK